MRSILLIIAITASLMVGGCKEEPTYQGQTQSHWMKASRDADRPTAQEAMWALENFDTAEAKGRVAEMSSNGFMTRAQKAKADSDARMSDFEAASNKRVQQYRQEAAEALGR